MREPQLLITPMLQYIEIYVFSDVRFGCLYLPRKRQNHSQGFGLILQHVKRNDSYSFRRGPHTRNTTIRTIWEEQHYACDASLSRYWPNDRKLEQGAIVVTTNTQIWLGSCHPDSPRVERPYLPRPTIRPSFTVLCCDYSQENPQIVRDLVSCFVYK